MTYMTFGFSSFWDIENNQYGSFGSNTITITGGEDATNIELINWLQNNATLQSTIEPVKLDTPVLSTEMSSSGAVLTWQPVDNALAYSVYKDNSLILANTTSTIFNLTSDGFYQVRALADISTNYSNSDLSEPLVVSNLIHFQIDLSQSPNVNFEFYYNNSGDTLSLTDFYCFDNLNIYNFDFKINNSGNTGYVFSDYTDLTCNALVNSKQITQVYNNQTIYFVFSFSDLLSSNVNISLKNHSATSLIGQWIYDKNLSDTTLEIGDFILFNRPFTSNSLDFDNIGVDNFNYLVYDNSNDNLTYVFSNLTGQYMPSLTYNYYLIDFETTTNSYYFIQDYLANDSIFFEFYRKATPSDLENISNLNSELIELNENYTFISLVGAIIDTHFNTLKSLLNFNFFGVNLWSLCTLFLTLTLIFVVIKFIKGGRKSE